MEGGGAKARWKIQQKGVLPHPHPPSPPPSHCLCRTVSWTETSIKRQVTSTIAAQLAGGRGQMDWNSVRWGKTYFVLGRLQQPGQDKNFLNRHNEPSEPTKKASLSFVLLKGIDRPFGRGVESILSRSLLVNWRLGYFLNLLLKGLLHKISKKPLDAA